MTEAATKDVKEPKKAPAVVKKKGPSVAELTRAMLKKSVNLAPVEKAPSTMPHIPSGSMVVDNLIGGSKAQDGKGQVCPGYPRRKITEIYGPESSGKTTLALKAVVEVQKAGGTVLYLDFEHSLHHGYAKQIGVKFDDSFILVGPPSLEDGLKAMYIAMCTGVDLVIIDSVAAMVPKAEFEKKFDDAYKVGAVAKKLSENLPKFAMWLMRFPTENGKPDGKKRKDHLGTTFILLNQERAVISTGGKGQGPQKNSTGGAGLKFYAYVRLRLSRISSEVVERKDPQTGKKKKFQYGNITEVKVVKAKADAKQGHSGNIFIRYGIGVDDVYSIIESGAAQGVIIKDGAWFSYNGERYQGREKLRTFLMANPKLLAEVREKVIQSIMNDAPVALSDEELSEEDAIEQSVAAMFDDDGEEADKEDGDSPKEVVIEAEDFAFIDKDGEGGDDAES
jgi:recombination protein RecA